MFRTLLISTCIICSATSADTPVVNEDFKLLASDGAEGDDFGMELYISGDGSTAIVGARANDDNGDRSGSAYIYEFVGYVWEETKLLASDAAYNDKFGTGVFISSDGSTAIVGANNDDNENGDDAGSAYVYSLVEGVWQETKLLASDGASTHYFGKSVAISGDGSTAIVGAYADDDNGHHSGSAYIYELVGGVWEETKLLASDGAEGDCFGNRVSISSDGSTAIVGAHQANVGESGVGAAYIYELVGGVWQETKLLASDGANGDEFGRRVSISSDGSTAIVGAANNDDNGSSSGSAYIYELVGGVWEETKLLASDGAIYEWFGISVSISGDGSTAIVGAYAGCNCPFNGNGSAYIYELVDGVWEETKKLLASDGAEMDHFGWSVSLNSDGTTALVGNWHDDDNGTDSGSAYLYYAGGVPGPTSWTVGNGGKADFDNIQDAVDAANDYDEIIVAAGFYRGGSGDWVVNPQGKQLWIHSSDGPEATVIDCEGSRRGILCESNETSGTVIEGFTITGGTGLQGGGLKCVSSSPTIQNCIFMNNSATSGGAVSLIDSDTSLTSCIFDGNTAEDYGGGVYSLGDYSPTLTDCTFIDNSANMGGGLSVYSYGAGAPAVMNCSFNNNTATSNGAAIFNGYAKLSGGMVKVQGGTLSDNTAGLSGGGMYSEVGNVYVSITVFCDNTPDHVTGEWNEIGANCQVTNCQDSDGDGVPDECETIDGWGAFYVPSDYLTIQDAIDAASDGDEILVGPGSYGSTTDSVINPLGKKLWIHSSDGPEVTFINGDGGAIICESGETEETVIEGFTINANAPSMASIECIDKPTFLWCVFENCYFYNDGESGGNTAIFEDCEFYSTEFYGWDENTIMKRCSVVETLIYFFETGGSDCKFYDCVFSDSTLEVMDGYSNGLFVQDCVFTNSSIQYTQTKLTISRCQFTNGGINGGMKWANPDFSISESSFSNADIAIVCAEGGRWIIQDCHFENNSRAIDTSGCEVHIKSCTFSDHSSPGTIFGNGWCSPTTIENSLFCGNVQPDIASAAEWEDLGGNGFFESCEDLGSDDLPRYWNNSLGGSFSDASNWWFPAMPGQDNDAIFDLESQYTINFSQNISTLSAIFTGGDVTFDLGGFEYENVAFNDPGLVVGDFGIGSSASLTIDNGSMFCYDAMLGRNSGAQGSLTLAGEDASLQTQSKLWVGFEGIGSLQLTDGAQLSTFSSTIGGGPGSSGSVVLSGSKTLWNSALSLEISRGYVDVQDEAEVQVGFLTMIYQGGEIRGDGVISSDVVNFGLVHPDMSTQPLRFNGDYEQIGQIAGFGSGTGLLQSTIGPASHGKLQVNGDAVIGGGVAVEIDEGFWEPDLGETFTLLSADSIDGHFDVALLPDLSGDKAFVVEYGDGTSVDVVVTGTTGETGFGDPLDTSIDGAASASTTGDFNNDGFADLAITLSGEGYWSTGSGIRGGGSTLTFGDHSIDANGEGWVNLMWQSDSYIAGFQIHLEGAAVISMEDGLVEQYGWDMWQIGGDVVCWAGIGVSHIPPQNSPVHLLKLHITGADNMLSFEDVIFGDDYQSAIVVDTSHTLNEVEALGNLLILINDTAGGFLEPAQQIEIDSNPQSITLGDFNGDNAIDMAIACANSNTVSIVENLGLGDGQFYLAWSIATGSDPRGITVTHANDDGVIDLAVVCSGDDVLQFLINELDGTFSDGGSVAVGEDPRSVQHGDDYNTLVVANSGENSVSLLQKVSGSSWNVETYEVGDTPTELIVTDLNLDGYDDAIVANYVDGTVTVLLSDGNGFNSQATLPIGDLPSSIASGDFDDDGDFDIAMITGSGAEDRVINILRNDINLTGGEDLIFASAQELAAGENPLFLNSGDIDGDGVVDLITVSGLIGIPGFRGSETSIVSSRHWLESSPCTGDFDADGDVDVADLLTLIAAWGVCDGNCPEDINGDGFVRVDDLLFLISAWGPCE